MEVTIRIKLINRFKPTGVDDYKKNRAMKWPTHARACPDDDLNKFIKTVKVPDPLRLPQQINEEVSRINEVANFQIKNIPEYGDKYIGSIDVHGYGDWSYDCYIPVKSNK